MTPRFVEDGAAVAGQVGIDDVAALRAAGFTRIINNRPDGEEPGQPSHAELAAAAARVGLEVEAMPIAGGFPPDAVEAMARAIEAADGPVLAFCRSGTRSAMLWALARASRGGDPTDLVARGAAAGYDLRALAPSLAALSSAAARRP